MVSGMSQQSQSHDPILASWKISEVLKRYPELLDVLVDLTPAFGKLRNPVLRRVQTRLVTVQQAAGIAGLDPGQLVRTLNQAVGITPPDEQGGDDSATTESRERPTWLDAAPVVRELDVRAMLEKGQEPFRLITGAAREVQEGEVLRLVANFEPLPLYDALAKQGFSHWAESLDAPDWQVYFHRDRWTGPKSSRESSTEVDWDAPATSEVTIDVSELVPPEPMVKILQALDALPDGARLLVHHVRRPMHLYDRLDEMGYAHETREIGPDRIEVIIQKPVDAS
jgi:uncharacterized protein (DUF2249 family)